MLIAGAILAAIGLPVHSAGAASGGITSYAMEIDIERDGTLQVAESVAFAPGTAPSESLLASIPSWSVPEGGRPVAITDRQVDVIEGESYLVKSTYSVRSVTRAFSADELGQSNPLELLAGDIETYAQVIGPLDATIEEARIVVRTPGPARAAACFVGGESVPMCTDRIGDEETTFRTSGLPPNATVTFAVVIDGRGYSVPELNTPATGTPAWMWVIAAAVVIVAAGALLVLRRRRPQ